MKYLLFMIFIAAAKLCAASTYYISLTGNDELDGIKMATSWKTIAKLNSVHLVPGDSVRFDGGSTFVGSIYLDSDDYGTTAAPVVFTSYGEGRAIINSGNNYGLYAFNTAGIEITGINFIGGTGNNHSGIYFRMDKSDASLSHIKIEDVDVSGFHDFGITVMCMSTKGYEDVLINRVVSHDNDNGGIQSGINDQAAFIHKNFRVTNCKVYNNKGIPMSSNQSGNGIVLIGIDGALIDSCESYNNGGNNTFEGGGPVGIWFAFVKNGIIQNSESHHNKTQTIDGSGFDLDGGCQNCIIQYCYSHDNDGGGFLMAEWGSLVLFTNNIIRYNISENDGLKDRFGGNGGIYIWATGGGFNLINCEIYNNTVYTSKTGIVISDSNFINVKISNNIFYGMAGSKLVEAYRPVDSTKVHLVQNDYYSLTPVFSWGDQLYNSLDSWKVVANTQERRGNKSFGLMADPLFNAPGAGRDGYRFGNNSPMIDAGLELDNIGPHDYYGGASRSGISQDIGAYEKQSGNVVLPVSFLAFSVTTQKSKVLLNWSTANEQQCAYYAVQRSRDGLSYDSVGAVAAKNGDTHAVNNYQFTDDNPYKEVNYYRLKQVDIDGRYSYSTVKMVVIESTGFSYTLLQNPVVNELHVSVQSDKLIKLQMKVIDAAGHLVATQQLQISRGNSTFVVPMKNLSSGLYFLTLTSGKISATKKFMKY